MKTLNIENLKINNENMTATFDYAGNSYFFTEFKDLVIMKNGDAILSLDDHDDINLTMDIEQDWDNEKTHITLNNIFDGEFTFSFECQ